MNEKIILYTKAINWAFRKLSMLTPNDYNAVQQIHDTKDIDVVTHEI